MAENTESEYGTLSEYGTFNELKRVSGLIRKAMFDHIMGNIDRAKFLRIYYEYEGFLLEHGYVSMDDPYFEMDLPDANKFLKDKDGKE
jgi:hypothetical protein